MKSFDTLVGKEARAAMRDDHKIKQVISRIVPATTLSHIEFCRAEGGRLRITIAGSAWIARLRFMERQIVDTVRASGFDCHTVSYHVAPDEKPIIRKTVRTANVSSNAVNRVEAVASSLTDGPDDKLRQELLKLARTLRER